MDKPRKEHDPDETKRWVEDSNITKPPEQKNRSWIIEVGDWRRKCQLLPEKSLKRHL